MPRKRRRSRKKRRRSRRDYDEDLPIFQLAHHTKRGILIVVLVLVGVLSFLALFDAAGSLGDILGKILELLFGWAALVAPVIFFGTALALFLAGRYEEKQEDDVSVSNTRVYIGAILFTIGLTGVLHLVAMRDIPDQAFELVKVGEGGGYIGVLSAFPLFSLIDFWAAVAVSAALVIVSFLLLFNINISRVWRGASDPREAQFTGRDSSQVKINDLGSAGFDSSGVAEANSSTQQEQEEEEEESGQPLTALPVKSFGDNEEKTFDYKLQKEKFRKGNWEMPDIDLLDDTHNVVDSGNIEANVAIVQKTLADFGIPVEMGEVNVGPTVTQYTLRPAQGIKLSQILNLQNDLALALAAPSIRIEAPIPGRSLVGIEVPNKATAIVRLKDVVATENFAKHKSSLSFALGRDVAGHSMIADLAAMPHLLIAGATGTGKSVAINSLIVSFLYRNSPEELRMIVIDPKRVELNLYNDVPHLLTPVVTDHQKAVNALRWAVSEMERRYERFAETGNRNITEYNKKNRNKLPYIVIIVDELADLMAVAQVDVEAAVVRLAQMARAVGIHLVLATQRPSVDIITGLIKANITARIAFAVASQIDSRTILDIAGAEKLLGNGDMLFITAELGKPKRIQGTYISEKEVKSVVDFVKEQAGEVEYSEEILEKQRASSPVFGFSEEDGDDALLPDAIEEVKRAKKASASFLQRRLRIGYARAARLLDLMEAKGIVGPADGAKPRDVYMSDEETPYQEDNEL